MTTVHLGTIAPHGEETRAVPWNVTQPGVYDVTAKVDPDNRVRESNETDNTATTSHTVPRPLDRPAHAYITFRDSQGADRSANGSEIEFRTSGTGEGPPPELRFDRGNDTRQAALVYLPWLDRVFDTPTSPEPFRIVEREDGRYVKTQAKSVLDGQAPAFTPGGIDADEWYTLGDEDRVQVAERAMQIEIVDRPGPHPHNRTLDTGNGSVTETVIHQHERLAVSFEAPESSGQPVRFAKQWLDRHGIEAPAFEHEDGSPIPFDTQSDYYVLHPEHFSTIYAFDTTKDAFSKEVDRFYSEVEWNPGLFDHFDDGLGPSDTIAETWSEEVWELYDGGAETGDCGSLSGSRALRFNQSGSRKATTTSLNTTHGGEIRFYLKIATGSEPCEDAETQEGVQLEYSVDGGAWTNLTYYDPNAFSSFTLVEEPIPSGAQADSVRFRWIQPSHSGEGFDVWVIEDVAIHLDGNKRIAVHND